MRRRFVPQRATWPAKRTTDAVGHARDTARAYPTKSAPEPSINTDDTFPARHAF